MNKYNFPEIKTKNYQQFCQILAVHSYLPDDIITNQDIIRENQLAVTDRVVTKTIGVAKRRRAAKGYCDSDLLVEAAKACLHTAGIKASNLSKIFVNKFLGDKLLPMTASFLQEKIQCPVAVQSFDIDGGTHSFLQSLDMAANMINNGDQYVLIASGGILNPLSKKKDARHQFLFGDAATAVLMGPANNQHILASYEFTNHDFIENTKGFQFKESILSILKNQDFNTSDVFLNVKDWKPALPYIRMAVKHTLNSLLENQKMNIHDIDIILVTEYNKSIRDTIISAINCEQVKVPGVLEKYGNTLCCSLPLLLCEHVFNDKFIPNKNILLLSIGEGISGGGMIYRT